MTLPEYQHARDMLAYKSLGACRELSRQASEGFIHPERLVERLDAHMADVDGRFAALEKERRCEP